ncbi:MAG: leucine-rich repeat domain-containing protein, partial [Lachnospiraceae bacterium]|nr:leucine-rich repeat domain-containing protein [Lachnospiraceae bacterium]
MKKYFGNMKKIISIFLVLTLAITSIGIIDTKKVTAAGSFEADGILYRINSNTEVSVMRCENYVGTNLVIPGKVENDNKEYKVTKIESKAYRNSLLLQKVVISEGIKTIDDSAFEGCEQLSEITIPKSLETVGSNGILSSCNMLEKVKFADGIETIPRYLCKNITSEKIKTVTVPDTVKLIGGGAFANMKNLEHVYMPDTVERINWGAFQGCENLQEINIPKNVTVIENNVYDGVKKPTTVIIPGKVTSIGSNVFDECENLKEITIPVSLESVGSNGIFNGCNKLEKINLTEGITAIPRNLYRNITSEKIKTVTVPDTVKLIGGGAFANMKNLEHVYMPDKVERINWGA